MENHRVLPFVGVFDECRNISYQKGENALMVYANCDTGSGPEDIKMKIFIAGQRLYLYYLQTPQTTTYLKDNDGNVIGFQFATGNL